jgi:hypothetical protein
MNLSAAPEETGAIKPRGGSEKLLEEHGYPPDEAKAAALTVLPDILRYNRAQPARAPWEPTPVTM